MWSRIYLIPLLQAEEDRDLVRRTLASAKMEKELLGGETKVYNSDRWVSLGTEQSRIMLMSQTGSCGRRMPSRRAILQSSGGRTLGTLHARVHTTGVRGAGEDNGSNSMFQTKWSWERFHYLHSIATSLQACFLSLNLQHLRSSREHDWCGERCCCRSSKALHLDFALFLFILKIFELCDSRKGHSKVLGVHPRLIHFRELSNHSLSFLDQSSRRCMMSNPGRQAPNAPCIAPSQRTTAALLHPTSSVMSMSG